MTYRLAFAILLVACGDESKNALPDAPVPGDTAPDSAVDTAPDVPAAPNTQIVFKSANDIFVMEADGSNPVNLTNTVGVIEDQPAWSPDKTKIAFHSNQDDVGEIYVMNADGTNITRLTTELGENDSNPTWSPDGTKIAFASRRDHLIGSIYVMNADGTNVQRLTNALPASDDEPAWSPDGLTIAFSTNEETNLHVAKIDVTGANRARVTPNTVSATAPTWSPDGAKLACGHADASGISQIFTVNLDGSGLVQLTTPSAQGEEHPTWSRDGARIAFDRNVAGVTHIFSITTAGTDELDLAGPAGAPIEPAF